MRADPYPFSMRTQARSKLEADPLVKQASVRKLYPNQIVIELIERTPYAVWQKDGDVSAIAADGAMIDQVIDGRYSDLPFVVGEGANGRAREYVELLEAMGELKPRVEAGVLVGQRRWNLRLKSGLDVKLPEDNPQGAIAELLNLQRQSRILEKDVLALDFRVPGRVFVRLTEDTATAWAETHTTKEGRSAMSLRSLAPRMRQIPARKSAILSVLDVGASKIVCLIARLTPMEPSAALRGRTHRCKVLGIGHQRSSGVKGGAVVDLHAAGTCRRLAIDAAERMAGVEVGGVIVNMSGGRLASRHYGADTKLRSKTVTEHDVHHVLEAAAAVTAEPGRTILHALPTAYRLDATKDVHDPRGMVGSETGSRSPSCRV